MSLKGKQARQRANGAESALIAQTDGEDWEEMMPAQPEAASEHAYAIAKG